MRERGGDMRTCIRDVENGEGGRKREIDRK